MVITNKDAYDSFIIMGGLRETGKLGYAIAKNMRVIRDAMKEYVDIRDDALKKYGKLESDGSYSIDMDDYEKYLDAFKEYDYIENDVPVTLVDEDTFMSGNLTNDQMYRLDWMVERE